MAPTVKKCIHYLSSDPLATWDPASLATANSIRGKLWTQNSQSVARPTASGGMCRGGVCPIKAPATKMSWLELLLGNLVLRVAVRPETLRGIWRQKSQPRSCVEEVEHTDTEAGRKQGADLERSRPS